MMGRTRRELVGFLNLVFSITLKPAPHYASPEALAAAVGVDVEMVRWVEAQGLLRSEPSREGRRYDGDDACIVATVVEMSELGGTEADIADFGAFVVAVRRAEAAGAGPVDGAIVAEMRALLHRMAARVHSDARRRRINRAVESIDVLADLV